MRARSISERLEKMGKDPSSLDSFQITYELTVFLTGERRINEVRAELNRHILDEFNEYGVQIMTPSYMADPPKPLVVEKDNWYAAPAKESNAKDDSGIATP